MGEKKGPDKIYDLTKNEIEKAVLVGVISQNQTLEQVKEYLDELAFLADTAGVVVEERFIQKLERPHPKTFVGKGKLDEVNQYIDVNCIGTVIFDDELSPSQL